MLYGLRTGIWLVVSLAVCGVSVASANETLVEAARAGHREQVRALLVQGLDPNATDRSGHTGAALGHAA